jgi:hypothetical protein
MTTMRTWMPCQELCSVICRAGWINTAARRPARFTNIHKTKEKDRSRRSGL